MAASVALSDDDMVRMREALLQVIDETTTTTAARAVAVEALGHPVADIPGSEHGAIDFLVRFVAAEVSYDRIDVDGEHRQALLQAADWELHVGPAPWDRYPNDDPGPWWED